MKKNLILLLITILSLVFFFCNGSKELDSRVKKIGEELIVLERMDNSRSNENFLVSDVVDVGESLFNVIQKSKPFDNVKINVKRAIISIGGAGYILEIVKEDLVISIKLKYYSSYDRFHILGFLSQK